MDVTLIIPTKNRFFFINKFLKYYRDLKFNGKILILDGSDDLNYNKLRVFINELKELTIKHVKTNQKTPFSSFIENLSYLDTEFVQHLGDDDYAIPNGIAQCIQHLRNNNDLIATHGECLMIRTPNFNTVPHINSVSSYPAPIRLEEKACERFINHYSNYATPWFQVFRSEAFKKINNFVSLEEIKQSCPYKVISDEQLFSAMSVIFGKCDKIKALHIIRGMHANRGGVQLKKNVIDTKEEDKQQAIEFFSKKVSLTIKESDKRPIAELEKLARDSIEKFLQEPKKEEKYNYKFIPKQTIMKMLDTFSLLEFARYFKRYVFNRTEFSLENLLKRENIYHKDFIHVYNSFLSHYDYDIE